MKKGDNMKKGIGIFNGITVENQVRLFREYDITRTFVESEKEDFDTAMRLFAENGIICETLHAPFNKINDLWSTDETAAGHMLCRLKDCVDKCAMYTIPEAIVHLSSGCPMPEVNEYGIARFNELFEYAQNAGVKIDLENQRYTENISYFMQRNANLGFCWDVGHEYCFTKGIKFMDMFGNRVSALHIHDNRCIENADDHLLPFDGNIDFKEVAKTLAKSGFEGTLMLEVGKDVKPGGEKFYNMSDDEYVSRAVNSLCKLEELVASFKEDCV